MKLTLKQAQEMMNKNGGNLDLRGTQITSLPKNLMIGGNLDLEGTRITSLPDNLTVSGWLDLSGTQITSLPDNLMVGGSLNLSGTQITSLPDNLMVGHCIHLSSTQITELPNNLIVGGSLELYGTAITSLPDNLIVGGWLDISDTQITELPDSLTIGRYLYLKDTRIKNIGNVKKIQNGTYVEGKYLYVDDILTYVKKTKKVGDYTLYIGKIKGMNVVSDGTYYAHCDDFRDGIADVLFKKAADRGAEQYKDLTLDSVLTLDEAKTAYRIITGACRQGTESFVESLGKTKDKYTVREMLEITKGQYGADKLMKFFKEA